MGERQYYDYIDLLKFFAGIAIIGTHLFNTGIEWGTYPFALGWIYVEFFFIVTGYFTTQHYLRKASFLDFDERMHDALRYTARKFIRLLPYTTPVILVEYIVDNLYLLEGGIKSYISGFANVFFELTYLSCATNHTPRTATVWFVSAMFLVFPFYCILLQMKSRNWLRWISFIIPVLYYCYFGVIASRVYPHDLVRAFSCMLIGTNICLAQPEINLFLDRLHSKVLITVIEVLSFLATVLAAYKNIGWAMNMCLVCFIVTLSVFFSGKSYSSGIHSSLLRWLGRLSVPLFIWNWTIATIIRVTIPGVNARTKTQYYIVACFIIPILHLIIAESIQKIFDRKKN